MTRFSIKIFLIFGMLTQQSLASSFGSDIEKQVQSGIDIIQSRSDLPSDMELLFSAWLKTKQKCEKDAQWCPIKTCDVFPKDCVAGHILLFRGESRKYPAPGTSPLWRSLKSGSSFGENRDVFGIIQQLEEWRLERMEEDRHRFPEYENNSNFRQEFFERHANAQDPIDFEDPVLGKNVNIDPMISFSLSPLVARSFAGSTTEGRVIVLSVPEKEITDLCPKDPPLPGDIMNSSGCEPYNEYDDEMEVDSFLYLKPGYIYRVYRN